MADDTRRGLALNADTELLEPDAQRRAEAELPFQSSLRVVISV